MLAIFRWKGDLDRLLAGYDREVRDPPPVVVEQPKRALHACAPTDDGMVIIDVRESEEDFRAMMDDADFQRNLQEADHPNPDTVARRRGNRWIQA